MQNSFAGEERPRLLSGVRAPIQSLLLVVVGLALAEVIGRITADLTLRWYLACFSVAFGIWTFAFYYRDGYRITEKWKRAVAFIGLSLVGFELIWLLYPIEISVAKRIGVAIILSAPAILELMIGRPLFKRTPQ